jgi:hypothetical protein
MARTDLSARAHVIPSACAGGLHPLSHQWNGRRADLTVRVFPPTVALRGPGSTASSAQRARRLSPLAGLREGSRAAWQSPYRSASAGLASPRPAWRGARRTGCAVRLADPGRHREGLTHPRQAAELTHGDLPPPPRRGRPQRRGLSAPAAPGTPPSTASRRAPKPHAARSERRGVRVPIQMEHPFRGRDRFKIMKV